MNIWERIANRADQQSEGEARADHISRLWIIATRNKQIKIVQPMKLRQLRKTFASTTRESSEKFSGNLINIQRWFDCINMIIVIQERREAHE